MGQRRTLTVDGREVGVVELLTGFGERQRGLLGTGPDGVSAWLTPCRSVHTWGMRYALDIALVGADDVVLAVRRLPPWRGPIRSPPGTISVLEAATGTFERWHLTQGSRLASHGPV